jgi:hypothetical protein
MITPVPLVTMITLLAIYAHSLLPRHQYLMSNQSGFSANNPASRLSSNAQPAVHLSAQDFSFATRIVFPPSVQARSNQYAEQITQEQGVFDLILLRQDNQTKYLIKVSSAASQHCVPEPTKACQQGAAPARGNVAEIQITLPGSQLKPGSYPFQGGITPNEEVITYSRKLYSDPSHGQLGCQVWDGGVFIVKEAIYKQNGDLAYLDASLERTCDRTTPFPRPETLSLQVQAEKIKNYTLHFTWRCRLTRELKG